MRTLFALLPIGLSLAAFSSPSEAHHSFAMFDQEHPIELVGTVKEFRYTSVPTPSSFSRSRMPAAAPSFGISKGALQAASRATAGRARF
jgi:hypothetical protein